jgi:hypothetical protein
MERRVGAVSPSVLGVRKAVQRVICEGLVTIVVLVIGDSIIVAVVAVLPVEIVADRKHRLAGRGCRHVDGLETIVVTERVGDAGKAGGLAALETRDLSIGLLTLGLP